MARLPPAGEAFPRDRNDLRHVLLVVVHVEPETDEAAADRGTNSSNGLPAEVKLYKSIPETIGWAAR